MCAKKIKYLMNFDGINIILHVLSNGFFLEVSGDNRLSAEF